MCRINLHPVTSAVRTAMQTYTFRSMALVGIMSTCLSANAQVIYQTQKQSPKMVAVLSPSHSTPPTKPFSGKVWKPSPAASASAHQQQQQQQAQIANGGTSSASSSADSLSGAEANNSGVSTTVSESSSMRYPRQTPPAFAGNVEPTISCANARNGGASSPVAGIAFGFSTKDKECDKRETARAFYEMGQPELAVRLLCMTQAAKDLVDCTYKSLPVADYDDDGYRDEARVALREKRMREHGFDNIQK